MRIAFAYGARLTPRQPMKTLFDPADAAELRRRLDALQPSSPRQWGKMNAPQAIAHCVRALEMALDERRPPRMLIGRLLGPIIKPLALRDDAPMRPNSPTMPDLRIDDERDFVAERARLLALLDRFVAAGPSGCTTHPHAFFGRLTPNEWGVLMYKHLDHHLRQFAA